MQDDRADRLTDQEIQEPQGLRGCAAKSGHRGRAPCQLIRPPVGGEELDPVAGSDRGGERAAAIYILLQMATLKDVDPRALLADVLARIASHPATRLSELLPWDWKRDQKPNAT